MQAPARRKKILCQADETAELNTLVSFASFVTSNGLTIVFHILIRVICMKHDGLASRVFPKAKVLLLALLAQFGFPQSLISDVFCRCVQEQSFPNDVLLEHPIVYALSAARRLYHDTEIAHTVYILELIHRVLRLLSDFTAGCRHDRRTDTNRGAYAPY